MWKEKMKNIIIYTASASHQISDRVTWVWGWKSKNLHFTRGNLQNSRWT